FGPETPTRSAPLLRALAARLKADGVVVVPAGSDERLANALEDFAEQMSVGCPLDIALMRSMGPGHVAWLGARLIELSERPPARQAAAAPEPAPEPGSFTRRHVDRMEEAPPAPPPAAAPSPAARRARPDDDAQVPARHLQQRSLRRTNGDTLER